jgi:hypothetical protein
MLGMLDEWMCVVTSGAPSLSGGANLFLTQCDNLAEPFTVTSSGGIDSGREFLSILEATSAMLGCSQAFHESIVDK